LDRPEELLHVDQERRQQADGQGARHDQVAAVADHDRRGQRREDVYRRGEGRGDRHGLDVGGSVGSVALPEALDVRLGAVEGLSLADADDLLLQPGRHVTDGLARCPEGPPCPAREVNVHQEHHRDDGEANQGQSPVEDEHRDYYPDQAEERAQKLRYPLREQLVQSVHVVRYPAHQVAHGAPVEEPEREPQQPLEDAFSQRGQDALTHRADLHDLAA
jgi:hypothetical protein